MRPLRVLKKYKTVITASTNTELREWCNCENCDCTMEILFIRTAGNEAITNNCPLRTGDSIKCGSVTSSDWQKVLRKMTEKDFREIMA